ncbi:hypothetical protein SAMN02910400_01053 [Lachnospiraceae bacterium C10]|nr:hypothetical protein SAMN02910400_01053 [Lachnospiraceae bacterium C10]
MLTSQQLVMREKLHNLITKNECELNEMEGNLSYSQKLFEVLCQGYLTRGKRNQSDFIEKTGLKKDTYRKLRGNESKISSVTESTLTRVVFGFGTTYEEAFLLFYHSGKNLLSDDPYTQKVNEVLLELDVLHNRSDVEKRMATLDLKAGELGIKL